MPSRVFIIVNNGSHGISPYISVFFCQSSQPLNEIVAIPIVGEYLFSFDTPAHDMMQRLPFLRYPSNIGCYLTHNTLHGIVR